MFSFLKNLLISSGVTPGAFVDVREELIEKNRSTLVLTGTSCALLFLGMFFSAFAGTSSAALSALRLRSRVLYMGITLLCMLVVLGAKLILPRRRRLTLPACYIFLSILFASAIYISTFNQPYYPGTTFCVFLVVLPLLIIDRPYRLLLFLICTCAAYLLCSCLCKTEELFTIDLLNCICFFYLSLTVGLFVQNLRVNEVVQRKAVERQRDRYSLTGLYNRAAFERNARTALLRGEVSAMLFLDIDNFKQINDSFGHVYGDAAIRTVAACIREAMPPHTLSGRFGGDEFILCLTREDGAPDVHACAQALRRAIRKQIVLPGCSDSATVSIGACVVPEAGLTYEELLHHADSALYHAKRHGKNQCCVGGR